MRIAAFAPHLAGRMMPGIFSYMPFGKKERFPGDPWPYFAYLPEHYWMHTSECSADPAGCLYGLYKSRTIPQQYLGDGPPRMPLQLGLFLEAA